MLRKVGKKIRDWYNRTDWVRWTNVAMYSCYMLVGFIAVFVDPGAVQTSTGVLFYVWATFVLLGGALGVIGSATGLWIILYGALPLITTAFLAYGIGLLTLSETNPRRSILALILLAIAFSMINRFYQLRELQRQTLQMYQTGDKREPG